MARAARYLDFVTSRVLIVGILSLCSGAWALAADAQGLSFAVGFEPPVMQGVGDYTRVTVAGCPSLRRVGEPVLPFRLVRLLLPPETTVVGVTARSTGDSQLLDGPWFVEPGRQPVSDGLPNVVLAGPSALDKPDPTIYAASEPYPAARSELISVQRMAGYSVALIRVFPVQFIPKLGRLSFVSQLTIELALAPGAVRERSLGPGHAWRHFRDRVTRFVDNPAMMDAYASDRRLSLANSDRFDYLLLTREALAPAFQPLLERKVQEGLAIKSETIENITASQTGKDLQEKIRNYIRHAYTSWGITYVLLGGDIATVPCRYAYAYVNQPEIDSLIPCDLYYACLDGSWNSDGDGHWGEPTDGEGGSDVDLLAEVYVGRAPVDTAAEAAIFVEKTIRFESQPHAHPGDALFIAEFLGDSPTGPAQGGRMFDPLASVFEGYRVAWLDDRPLTTPQWTKIQAIDAMNGSPQMVLFNGHGESDVLIGGGSLVRRVEASDLELLTNQSPFLAYSVGCNVGQYDNDKFSPDCIGEELIKSHSRGAMAAVFNSRVGWYLPQEEEKYSGEFQEQFFAELLGRGRTQLGVANQLGKHAMLGHVEASGLMTYRFCYYEITLLGDPHLSVKPASVINLLTSHGTPHSWLASFGWTNDVESADIADADGDGLAAWQEYVAGNNPTEPLSVLRISTLSRAEAALGWELTWPSVAGRVYAVSRSMVDDLRGFVEIGSDLPATPPHNLFVDPDAGPEARFYRIEVELSSADQ